MTKGGKMPTLLVCRLCAYEWEPRVKAPKACPRCKRYDWDRDA